LILGFVDYGFSGGDETAFLQDASAGRVVDEVSGNKGLDISHRPDMLDHQIERFCANTFVPIGFSNPIADKRLPLTGRKVALT
jgi:hypothetical protein